MKRFQTHFIVAYLAVAMSVVALAEPSSTAKVDSSAATQVRPASRPAEYGRPFIGEPGRPRPNFPPSDEQVRAAEAFVGTHSPNHFKMYQELPDRFQPRSAIVQGYLDLQAVGLADPDLYKMKIDEIELQDKIFGILAKRAEGLIDRQSAREQIRPLEKQVIELRRAEANHRIERMQIAIQNEKDRVKNLDQISANGVDAMIDNEIEHGISNGPFRLGLFRGAPGPGGFRGMPPPTTSPSRLDQP